MIAEGDVDRILSRCLQLLLLLVLCPLGAAAQTITGNATWRERIALPPNAVFEAVLQDVSRIDAGAPILGRVRIAGPGQSPIDFTISYDPAQIRPEARYGVTARIRAGDRLVLVSDRLVPVLTRGAGSSVELAMRATGRERAPSAPTPAPAPTPPRGDVAREAPAADGPLALQETYWRLTQLRDARVETSPRLREPHLVFGRDGAIAGSGGCNRLVGSYMQILEQIEIGGVGTTRIACAEGMEQEARFTAALGAAARWRIADGNLDLFDVAGDRILRFEAAPPPR